MGPLPITQHLPPPLLISLCFEPDAMQVQEPVSVLVLVTHKYSTLKPL